MSNPVRSLTVALDPNCDADFADALADAIRQFRGVIGVTPTETATNEWIARQQVRNEISEEFGRLWTYITTGERNKCPPP
jgi:hypothetical protein